MTRGRPSVSLFFPAWNEEDYVDRALDRAVAVLGRVADEWELLLIDDASTDRTRELALARARQEPRIKVLTHERNLKLGGALKTGFSHSTKDVVVYSDIDLPFDLAEVERALHLMDYLEADMICAFRHDRTSEGPRRMAYSFAYNWLIRGLFGVYLKDINFSFKVVHRRVLEAIELKSQGSFIDAELVVKATKKGFRVFQMGVDYFPRTRGTSSLASPAVIATMLRELWALREDTLTPGTPARPVRLPPHVSQLHPPASRLG